MFPYSCKNVIVLKNGRNTMNRVLDGLIKNYPELEVCRQAIADATEMIIECYKNGGKILLCGNGGSASDTEHIAGELLKGFLKKRPLPNDMRQKFVDAGGDAGFADKLQGSLPAISLTGHPALATAYINDVDAEFVFAQQLYGLGKPGDILIAMSTSGNARNVANAVICAKATGLKVIALTGTPGGRMRTMCDVAVCAPSSETFRIQEYQLPIYHAICVMVEEYFFKS